MKHKTMSIEDMILIRLGAHFLIVYELPVFRHRPFYKNPQWEVYRHHVILHVNEYFSKNFNHHLMLCVSIFVWMDAANFKMWMFTSHHDMH